MKTFTILSLLVGTLSLATGAPTLERPCPMFILEGQVCTEPWLAHCPCAGTSGGVGASTSTSAPLTAPTPTKATTTTRSLHTTTTKSSSINHACTPTAAVPVVERAVCPMFILKGKPCTEPQLQHCPCALGAGGKPTTTTSNGCETGFSTTTMTAHPTTLTTQSIVVPRD